MPSFQEQLEQARNHVDQARHRIEEQNSLIERLKADGHDTKPAELLLRGFFHVLDTVTRHLAELESHPPR
jgi:hypothetical protein